MWKWLLQQIDISDELSRFSAAYMGLSGIVMGMAFLGLYFQHAQQNNHLLGMAIIVTLMMSIYERYRMKAYKSANLTLLSAVIYSLLMI